MIAQRIFANKAFSLFLLLQNFRDMETYALVLSYAIPGFVLLIIIESFVAKWRGMRINRPLDTISSLSSGMTNTLKALLGLSVVIISYGWMVKHLAIFEIKSTVWLYILAFIGLDFAGYWSHRWNHHINLFWNRHIVHHSSEEFNLSCALRQTISTFVGIYFFLYIPMAIIGIPAKVVAVVAPLHLFAQFWYHTRLINKMGWLEYIIVTPSHHRVHHAINDEYLDRNFSEIFIVWDKLFGTFQEELPEVPPIYGTKRPAKTWNPFLINFMHLWTLIQDAWRAKNWWDKARIWFMPTGWRPEDVAEKHPISYYKKASEQIKYDSQPSRLLTNWSWLQLVVANLLMYHLLVSMPDLTVQEVILYVSFLSLCIFAYTTLMDKHRLAVPASLLTMLFGGGLLYVSGGWFGLEEAIYGANAILLAFLILTFGVAVFVIFSERGKVNSKPIRA